MPYARDGGYYEQKAVALYHPRYRSTVYTLELGNVIYDVPNDCSKCWKQHIFKTYHLDLNEQGYAFVTPHIYEIFKREGILGELVAKGETEPYANTIGMDYIIRPEHIVSREHGEQRLYGRDLPKQGVLSG